MGLVVQTFNRWSPFFPFDWERQLVANSPSTPHASDLSLPSRRLSGWFRRFPLRTWMSNLLVRWGGGRVIFTWLITIMITTSWWRSWWWRCRWLTVWIRVIRVIRWWSRGILFGWRRRGRWGRCLKFPLLRRRSIPTWWSVMTTVRGTTETTWYLRRLFGRAHWPFFFVPFHCYSIIFSSTMR